MGGSAGTSVKGSSRSLIGFNNYAQQERNMLSVEQHPEIVDCYLVKECGLGTYGNRHSYSMSTH